jgi:hypothetical protein
MHQQSHATRSTKRLTTCTNKRALITNYLQGCLGNSPPIKSVQAQASGIENLSLTTRCRTRQVLNTDLSR